MQPQASPWASLVPVAAIFAIFYFLVFRPQQQQQKDHDKMLAAVKKGDRILTTGGLYGVVVAVKGQDLELKISEQVKVLIARSAIARLAPEGEAVPENAAVNA